MQFRISKLLDIAGPPLGMGQHPLRTGQAELTQAANLLLSHLLSRKNGFYAFESALHVFPVGPTSGGLDLEAWNDERLWKREYDGSADGLLFFAEDSFGGQFGLRQETVYRFEPETGETEAFAPNLDGWAGRILEDCDFETGYSLAHTWQALHGPLRPGDRLLPKQPFVLGGAYEAGNLYSVEAVKGMRFRAAIARQIRNAPDGSTVKIKFTDL